MQRLVRFAWNWVATFCQNIGRLNDYYWPGERCGIKMAAFVATCVARGCDRVRYGHDYDFCKKCGCKLWVPECRETGDCGFHDGD